MITYGQHDSRLARSFHRLTSGLQSALSVAEVESAYLEGVPGVLPADGHGLYRLDPDTLDPVSISADVTTAFMQHYTEYGRFDDPVMDRVYQSRRPVDSSRVGGTRRWEESATYHILAEENLEHSLRAPIEIAGQFCGTVTFARRRGAPQFGAFDLTVARRISEQAGLALERAIRFEATNRRSTIMEDALNHLPQGVIVTDPQGTPIFVNRAASITSNATRRPYADVVAEQLRANADELWNKNRRLLTANVRDAASGATLIVKSVRLTSKSEASMTLVYATEQPTGNGPLPVWDVLTPREQEIAEFVSAGLSTKQIAARAFVSENTVKQHLKRIFAKTDVRNRAELMQRIWTSSPVTRGDTHELDQLR